MCFFIFSDFGIIRITKTKGQKCLEKLNLRARAQDYELRAVRATALYKEDNIVVRPEALDLVGSSPAQGLWGGRGDHRALPHRMAGVEGLHAVGRPRESREGGLLQTTSL